MNTSIIYSIHIPFMKSIFLKLSLLLAALLPLTEHHDVLFCLCGSLALALFIAFVIAVAWNCCKAKKSFLPYIIGNRKDSYIDLCIAIIGLAVHYFANTSSLVYLGWFILFISLSEILWATKSKYIPF